MTYILSIETATRNCSVSISRNGETIALKEIAETGYTHAEKLHVFIEEVLADAQITFKELNAIAVSQGPGSYTGLRIGVSTAKGLCYALQIPLIAIDTLEILANNLNIEKGLIIPMIDARRMECYTAVFNKNHQKIREVLPEVIKEDSFKDFEEDLHILGDGAAKCQAILTDSKFKFYTDFMFPSAQTMSSLANAKFQNNNFVDVAYFEPFYLKEFLLQSK